MTPPLIDKKEIHQSHLDMLFKCGEQFRRRYVQGEIRPPGAALVIGSGVHAAAEKSFLQKFELQTLPAIDEITDYARDSVVNQMKTSSIILTPEEAAQGLEKTTASIIDTTVACARLHRETLAERIMPAIKPEKDFVLNIGGWKLGGRVDLYDTTGTVRDLKTAKRKPQAAVIKQSLQMTLYALAVRTMTGETEVKVALDHLLKDKIELVTLEGTRNADDFGTLINRIRQAVKCIEAGVFLPAHPGSWWCSSTWCGYWADCPYKGKE